MLQQGVSTARSSQSFAASASLRPAAGVEIGNVTTTLHSQWRTAFVASVVMHAAIAAWALLGMPNWVVSQKSDEGAIAVEIAPAPAAPAAPPKQQSPGPERVRSVEKPTPIPQPKMPPPPEVPTATQPEVALAAKPPQQQPDRPMLKRTEDETTAPSAMTAPPRPQTAAPVQGASVATSAVQTWESLLLAKLERNKRYPGASQSRGEQDVVYVRMTVNRAGRLLNASIVKSHGYALLDGEVLSLVRRASPYGAPPEAEVGNPIELVVPVNFFVTHRR